MKYYKRLVQPYVVWIALFILIPMLLIVLYAFTKQGNETLTLQFTLENFVRFFKDTVFIDVLITSLRIALITTVLCILLGYPMAFIISKMDANKSALFVLLITAPTWINMLVRTYAWIGILSDNGLVNSILGFFCISAVKLIYPYHPRG